MFKIADIIHRIANSFPNLKSDLRKANIKDRPDTFIKKTLFSSMFLSSGLTIFLFFMFSVFSISILFLILAFPLLFFVFFNIFMQVPKNKIIKRRRDLDREALFAGRFLLVKLYSGRPLLNALMDAVGSYGVASQYFKEIVDDVNLGTPIEQALENAIRYTPSDKFRKILLQINNSIRIGVDITGPLSNTLDEITSEQMIEIKKYGKKLNTLAMLYMLLAVVLPSLGMAMFVVIGGLLGLPLNMNVFILVIVMLVIFQFLFISIFKSTRLTVNL